MNGAEQVTFQIPCEATAGSSVPVTINVSGGSASANIALTVAAPGIFETVMSDNVRRAVVTPARRYRSSAWRIRRGAAKLSAFS